MKIIVSNVVLIRLKKNAWHNDVTKRFYYRDGGKKIIGGNWGKVGIRLGLGKNIVVSFQSM